MLTPAGRYRIELPGGVTVDVPGTTAGLVALAQSRGGDEAAFRLKLLLAEAQVKFEKGVYEFIWKPMISVGEMLDLDLMKAGLEYVVAPAPRFPHPSDARAGSAQGVSGVQSSSNIPLLPLTFQSIALLLVAGFVFNGPHPSPCATCQSCFGCRHRQAGHVLWAIGPSRKVHRRR